jgi:hypothetical protein
VKLDDRSALAQAELFDGSGQVVARARAELRVRERNTQDALPFSGTIMGTPDARISRSVIFWERVPDCGRLI